MKRKARRAAAAAEEPAVVVHQTVESGIATLDHQPRWALASDGNLVLFDGGGLIFVHGRVEIPKAYARALVDFVRTLYQAEA